MTLYELHVEIEADNLMQAWGYALFHLPGDFGPETAEKAARRGIREFRLEAIEGDAPGIQRVEATFAPPQKEAQE